MSLSQRLFIYVSVVVVYVLFGLLEGWYDIFPWGAVGITVLISAAELGTYLSIKNRK